MSAPPVIVLTNDDGIDAPGLAALERAGITPESKEIVRIPTNSVDVDDVDTARKVLALMERLDDHDEIRLSNLILMMRRQEKDFLLTGDPKYKEMVLETSREFNQMMTIAKLSPAMRDDIDSARSLLAMKIETCPGSSRDTC